MSMARTSATHPLQIAVVSAGTGMGRIGVTFCPGKKQAAQAAIHDAGVAGLTADELAARLKMDRWSIQPRTSELRRKGLIRDSGQRRPNVTGKAAIVWIAK